MQEGAQSYERALCQYQSAGHESADDPNHSLSAVVNLYRPLKPSNASPMQVFCTMGTSNDPMPLYAKTAMEKTNVGIGSLETVHLRALAADSAANAEVEDDDDDDEEISPPRECLRQRYDNARSKAGGTPRVMKPVMKTRKSGVSGNKNLVKRRQKLE